MRQQDIEEALNLGIDELGFVFAGGPRNLSLDTAKNLITFIREKKTVKVKITLLFMDQSQEYIKPIIKELQPDQLQFHGQETAKFCDQFGLPWTKAIAAGDSINLADTINHWAKSTMTHGPVAVILDAHRQGEAGGQGEKFDWQRIPQRPNLPIYIAGGLSPDNVAEAIQHYRPYAVDVSSGIEDSPGIKNHVKMRTFVAEVKHAEQ